MSQEALAEAAGIGVRTVRDIERGVATRPRPDTLRRLANALGLSEVERLQLESHFRARNPTPSRKPYELPRDLKDFVGRARELSQIEGVLLAHAPAAAPGIVAIVGPAGVGKTALAVHAAHGLAARFPDGQLFVDLHGFTEAVAQVEPAAALERMLRALGVPGEQIPANLGDRAGLWRSTLAPRRLLIVLDNAGTEAQVEHLLPGSAGCPVLVTSRVRLSGLDGVESLSLDVLPPGDARALFTGTLDAQRSAGVPLEQSDEVVELCGRLPLGIRIAAARLRSHPAWGVADLAERLRDARHRLGELEAGQRSVTAALDLSYRQLPGEQQRAYRLLGLHPGPDVEVFATAALLDLAPAATQRLLDRLLEAHLLVEPAPGRYRFHDLTRAHAAQCASGHREQQGPQRSGGPQSRTGDSASQTRLFDHYRYTASVAMDLLYPYDADQRPDPPPPAGSRPAPAVTDRTRAAAWLDAELPNLLAVAAHAADHGWPGHTIDLSAILARHLRTRYLTTSAEVLHARALAIARGVGDRTGELATLTSLGQAHRMVRRFPSAEQCLTQALTIARDTGNRAGELTARNGLGHVHRAQARYQPATDCFGQALAIARDLGNRHGELVALLGLGYVHRVQGSHESAAEHFEQARMISCSLADRGGETTALFGLGVVNRALGRYDQGVDNFRQALAIARATRDRIAEVNALWGLGQVYYMAGQGGPAADQFASALALARDIGDRNGQFEGRHGLGLVRCATGDPAQALLDHQAAHQLAGELSQPVDQARALSGMAGAHRDLGQPEQARRCWEESLSILEGLGIREVEEVRTDDIRGHLSGASSTKIG